MRPMISPASRAVFGAVSSEVTPNGTVEKFPKTETEWAAVRRQALTMVEGANILLTPRPFAVPPNAHKHNEGELAPTEIEARVSKERPAWNRQKRFTSVTASRHRLAVQLPFDWDACRPRAVLRGRDTFIPRR